MNDSIFRSQVNKPIYGQIQDAILAKIKSKLWEPGTKIPSERRLAELFAVSVGTVRTALRELVTEGYLERMHGKGTFVRSSITHSDALRYYRYALGFDEEVKSLGIVCNKISRCNNITIASLLNLADNAELIQISRTFFYEDEPVVYVDSFLPALLFPDLDQSTTEELEGGVLYKHIEERYGMPTLSTKDSLSAILADRTIATKLNVSEGAPVLKIEMLASTTRNIRHEYRISCCKTDKYQIIRDSTLQY